MTINLRTTEALGNNPTHIRRPALTAHGTREHVVLDFSSFMGLLLSSAVVVHIRICCALCIAEDSFSQ